MSTGKVIQVIGPVVDVEFPPGQLPNIYNALKVTQEENKAAGKPAVRITLEVASHLGENRVRGIAMSTTVRPFSGRLSMRAMSTLPPTDEVDVGISGDSAVTLTLSATPATFAGIAVISTLDG